MTPAKRGFSKGTASNYNCFSGIKFCVFLVELDEEDYPFFVSRTIAISHLPVCRKHVPSLFSFAEISMSEKSFVILLFEGPAFYLKGSLLAVDGYGF